MATPGPSNAPGRGATAGDDVLRQAMFALNNGRPAEAERIASDVLKRSPRHARALHVLGCALLTQGRHEEAIAPLEDAARGRHDPDIDTHLAVALRQAGRSGEALVLLKRATKRQPHAAAFHELGFVLHEMGRTDEAIEALKRGLAIAPMMLDLSIQLGHVYLSRNDRPNAKMSFAHALAINPEHPDALYGISIALLDDSDFQAAAGHLRRYVMARPGDSRGWIMLGSALVEMGQTEAGYDCIRKATHNGTQLYGAALNVMVKAGRGRFFLKPSAAASFLRGK